MNNRDTPTLELTRELVRRASVTPDDAGCNALLARRLQALGFTIEVINQGGVRNFWARLGSSGPVLCFAGHTDVVPPGPLDAWHSPPFEPEIRDDRLYGRGTADMKGSLAAMITACERFCSRYPAERHPLHGSLAFLITSDEEGPARDGTRAVIERLRKRDEQIDYCVVGEPSSQSELGDVIKIGRRGSLHGRLVFHGVQGHIAYPHLAHNPIHDCLAPLRELCSTVWDEGNEGFPPTSFQISNIHGGTGADNVIPGELEVIFNFRYSTESSRDSLTQRTEAILERHGIRCSLTWSLSGEPFLTLDSAFVDTVANAITTVTGLTPQRSTSGGTSDGRFIAPTGAHLVELGPCNDSIHKIDEHVRVADLETLSVIYEKIMQDVLLPPQADTA